MGGSLLLQTVSVERDVTLVLNDQTDALEQAVRGGKETEMSYECACCSVCEVC